MKKCNLCLLVVAIALSCCQMGLAKEEPTAKDWLSQGIELDQKGNHAEAIRMFTEAIELDSRLAEAYFQRGRAYREHRKTLASDALRDFNRALELDPGNAEAYYERGLLNAFMLNNENAYGDMRTAARMGHEGAARWLKPVVETPPPPQAVAAAPAAEAPPAPEVKADVPVGPPFPLGEYLASGKAPVAHFDFNRAEIKPQEEPLLDEVGLLFKNKLPQARIVLGGHTDSTGTEAYNDGLSLQRAKAVETYLQQKHGLAADRFILKGFGKRSPVASNKNKKGQAQNRRVEIMGEGKR
jgi:outer membrane protein OmpA-like peptidoglycan-associated protein